MIFYIIYAVSTNKESLEDKKIRTKKESLQKEKIGKFSPGAHIPIVSMEKFYEDMPDVAFLFAWNHRKEIEKKYNFSNSVKVLTHLRGDIESTI